MFKVGSTHEHESRVAGATTSTNTPAPPLYGLRKDHKPVQDSVKGPPVRPVCGANQSPNSRLSHFLSRIINDYADAANIQTECKSSEEMKAAFEEYNRTEPEVRKQCRVLSMDVKALYPSMEWEEIIVSVREMIENSEEVIENADYFEIGKYLAVTLSKEEIDNEKLQHVIPQRKIETNRNITIAYLCNKKNEDQWCRARKPGHRQKKKMLALAVAEGVRVCMASHVYTIGDKLFLQLEGGPIGLELTGAVSRPFMLRWDRLYLERVEEAGMKMMLYKRYVDDSNQTAVVPPVGSVYDKEKRKVVISEEQHDQSVPEDERLALVLLDIANSIMRCVGMEADTPSRNSDGKLPILEMKVWTDENGILLYQHYEKPVSSKTVMHSQSAHSSMCKRGVHTQEVLRRLLNCSQSLSWEADVAPVITEYMSRMKVAGYRERYRKDVLKHALNIYDKKWEDHNSGIRPIFRPKDWHREERKSAKERKRHEWATKGGYIAPIFVPSTPGSELMKRMRQVVDRESKKELRFKIVEMGGRTLKSELQKSNPTATPGCEEKDCLGCRAEKGKGGQCHRNNVNYQIECQLCPEDNRAVYIGETARNMYTRGTEHMYMHQRQDDSSFISRHMDQCHEGLEPDLLARVTHTNSDCLTRQVREGVHIRRCQRTILNTKSEWFQPSVYRVQSEVVRD